MGTDLFILGGPGGIEVEIRSLGAAIGSVRHPDGTILTLPPDGKGLLGQIVGRYANRIAGGRFELDGTEFQLTQNEGRNHLHGGAHGFQTKDWVEKQLVLSHTSPDGDEGYPGELSAEVRFTLVDDMTLGIHYTATTSKPTILNLTHHPLFNLAGAGTILDHELELDADTYVVTDEEQLPTGELAPVEGTRFDFRRRRALREELDQCFVLNGVARLTDPDSGRTLEVRTDQPGIQVYTGNHLPVPHTGIALETQHFPDSPNHPQFPSTVLRPGETFTSTTELRFT
ncbi:MAG TPA: aldose epimerase family protein [Gaiellaceae bacterium]|nr:aldose epimerase family protein [Gaiellaceae bacterium]